MARYHLKKLPEDSFDDPNTGGGWIVHKEVSYEKDEYLGHYMMMRCPKCLQLAGLELHSIEPNGEVNASILCNCRTKDGECGWHEWAVLDEWDSRWRKNAGDRYLTKI